MQENNDTKNTLFFAALNPYMTINNVENVEKKINGKDFVSWGENNGYSQFLWQCYNDCATLQAVVDQLSDYIVGDNVVCNVPDFDKVLNKKGETVRDIVQKISMDYLIFGAFALQVIRNLAGNVAEIYWVDINKIRSDEKNEIFFYSDDWNKSYGRVKYVSYPKFTPGDANATSIFYFKGHKTRSVYGVPMWNAATPNVMIDIAITKFHQNEINNNFMGSKLISFNNGIPDENLKAEVERNIVEKFSGSENAGRIMISFSQSKDNAPVVVDLGTDDFDKRYESLEKRNKEQIFVAFRCTPTLCGMIAENNGFSTNEYRDSYKLFNKTVVRPIQTSIVDCFDKIFGKSGSVAIEPFTIEFEEDNKEEKVN